MACGLTVLVNISEELTNRFTPEEISSLKTPEGKEKHKETLKEIYHNACGHVISEGDYDGALQGVVAYFRDKAMSFEDAEDEEGYGFGATRPDEIRKKILSWNRDQSMHVIRLLEAFEAQAEQKGIAKLSELFASSMTGDGRIQWEMFPYPASLYELRKALDAADNVFTYGQDKLVYSESEGLSSDISPYAPSHVINRAKEHPEDFLILEVYYD